MFLILLSLILVLALLVSWISLVKESKRFNVKGPTPLPLLGNAHLFVVKTTVFTAFLVWKNGTAPLVYEEGTKFLPDYGKAKRRVMILTEFLNLLQKFAVKYGQVYRVHFFSAPYVVICHSKYAEALVSSTEHITKGRSYSFLTCWLGQGLLTATGQRWKTHRKFLTPAFHFNILQNFLPVFCKNQRILTEKLRGMADGRSVDMFPLVALAALDNVNESIMGVSMNAQKHSESEYVKSIEELSAIVSMRMQIPFFGEDAIFNLLPYKTRQDKALKILHGQTNKVIEARRQELKKANITTLKDSNDMGIKNKHAFLDLLLLAEMDGKKMDDESIREEVDTFMFEGHDTTTSGIVYTLHCLSKRRDVQEKIYEELKTIYGSEMHRDPTYHELHDMKYLELVIKESMRLFPPVPLFERRIMRDCEVGGLKLIKGTSALINVYLIQRQPDLFEDPLEFRPERFEAPLKNAFSWLAFSAGPRNCIGQKFAMMELKITISEIVKNFYILPAAQEPELSADLVLRSKNGVHVKFMPRN